MEDAGESNACVLCICPTAKTAKAAGRQLGILSHIIAQAIRTLPTKNGTNGLHAGIRPCLQSYNTVQNASRSDGKPSGTATGGQSPPFPACRRFYPLLSIGNHENRHPPSSIGDCMHLKETECTASSIYYFEPILFSGKNNFRNADQSL